LTGGRALKYAQEQEETGFFSNVTTVLPLSRLVRDHVGSSSVSGEPAFDGSQAKGPPKWQSRLIIPINEAFLAMASEPIQVGTQENTT